MNSKSIYSKFGQSQSRDNTINKSEYNKSESSGKSANANFTVTHMNK